MQKQHQKENTPRLSTIQYKRPVILVGLRETVGGEGSGGLEFVNNLWKQTRHALIPYHPVIIFTYSSKRGYGC